MTSRDVDTLAAMAWEAALPVKCTLDDVCREDQQGANEECFFMVPRQGYLGYSLKVVLRTFGHLRVLGEGRTCYLWFTYKAAHMSVDPIIVPWHYPMGVVCDRLAAFSGFEDVTRLFHRALELTVVFSDSPPMGEEVIPLTVAGLEKGIDIRIKQAHKAFIMARFNSTKPWVSMDPSAINNFLAAPRTNDPGAFFVGRTALEQQCKRDLGKAEYDRGEKIALVNIHVEGRVIPFAADVDAFPTLGTLLREVLPCCYHLKDDDVQSFEPLPPQIAHVFLLGTKPPLGAPLAYLRDHLCCADLAVHVVVGCVASNAPRPRPKRAPVEEKEMTALMSTSRMEDLSLSVGSPRQLNGTIAASPRAPAELGLDTQSPTSASTHSPTAAGGPPEASPQPQQPAPMSEAGTVAPPDVMSSPQDPAATPAAERTSQEPAPAVPAAEPVADEAQSGPRVDPTKDKDL
jgi:hypothetical protein